MAAYETTTTLSMLDATARAREFFELEQGLRVVERLGARLRWQGTGGGSVELRAFPAAGGSTRLELETLHDDALVLAFIHALPHPGLLDELRRRLRGEG